MKPQENKLNKLKSLKKEYDKQVNSITKETFKKQLQNLFIAYPDLLLIEIKCYTPGFNDGDPCSFTVSFDSTESIWFNYNSYPEFVKESFMSLLEENPSLKDDPLNLIKEAISDHLYVSFYLDPAECLKLSKEDKHKLKLIQKCQKEVAKVIHGIPDEVFESVFGDYVKILFTKNKIEVNEYDCGY